MPLPSEERRRNSPSCTVILPTYNERENLQPLVHQLMAQPGVHVLIVDDASPDGTGELAERLRSEFGDRVALLRRVGRRGLGSAYLEGMRRVLASGSPLIAQMDADLSHDVRDLETLISAASNADLVIGSRYVPGGRVLNWSTRRLLLSKFANWYVRVVVGLRIRDATAGYRCWRSDALRRMPLARISSNGYAFQVEMTWHALRLGLRVVEVPIAFVERRAGQSKLSWAVVLESILLPWRIRGKTSPSP